MDFQGFTRVKLSDLLNSPVSSSAVVPEKKKEIEKNTKIRIVKTPVSAVPQASASASAQESQSETVAPIRNQYSKKVEVKRAEKEIDDEIPVEKVVFKSATIETSSPTAKNLVSLVENRTPASFISPIYSAAPIPPVSSYSPVSPVVEVKNKIQIQKSEPRTIPIQDNRVYSKRQLVDTSASFRIPGQPYTKRIHIK